MQNFEFVMDVNNYIHPKKKKSTTYITTFYVFNFNKIYGSLFTSKLIF